MAEPTILTPGHRDGCICAECENRAREADRDREIGRLVAEYPARVRDAQKAVTEVRHVVTQLMSPYLYDIETAEGPDGPDALNELDEILRRLRNVHRIAAARIALEEQENRDAHPR